MQKRASALLSRGPDAIRPAPVDLIVQANCDNLNRLPDVLVEWRLSRQRAGGREESGLGSKADVDRPPSHPTIRRRGPCYCVSFTKVRSHGAPASRVRSPASDPHCIPRALVAKQGRTIDLLDIDLARSGSKACACSIRRLAASSGSANGRLVTNFIGSDREQVFRPTDRRA